MFFSNLFLTKRSVFYAMWKEALFKGGISKKAILDCDVLTLCSAIEVPKHPLSLRVSANLLLGVTKIYMRKAKYLQGECMEIWAQFRLSMRAPSSIDLPGPKVIASVDSINVKITDADLSRFLSNSETTGLELSSSNLDLPLTISEEQLFPVGVVSRPELITMDLEDLHIAPLAGRGRKSTASTRTLDLDDELELGLDPAANISFEDGGALDPEAEGLPFDEPDFEQPEFLCETPELAPEVLSQRSRSSQHSPDVLKKRKADQCSLPGRRRKGRRLHTVIDTSCEMSADELRKSLADCSDLLSSPRVVFSDARGTHSSRFRHPPITSETFSKPAILLQDLAPELLELFRSRAMLSWQQISQHAEPEIEVARGSSLQESPRSPLQVVADENDESYLDDAIGGGDFDPLELDFPMPEEGSAETSNSEYWHEMGLGKLSCSLPVLVDEREPRILFSEEGSELLVQSELPATATLPSKTLQFYDWLQDQSVKTGGQPVSFAAVSQGARRSHASRAFSHVLALASKDFVQVSQPQAMGNIYIKVVGSY